MLDSLRGYFVFSHVAETQSFSRAAEQLGITKSAVSKHVSQLEAELGVQLIVRTTRRLALTDAGERVFAHCARMATDMEAARDAAFAERTTLAGKLRITAPAGLGRNFLMPVLSEFLALHPALSIELIIYDAFVDLLGERIDIALRVGGRTDKSLVSRRIAPVQLFLVAAPSYLAKHPALRSPRDLADHDWITHEPSPSRSMELHKGNQRVVVKGRSRLTCNDGLTNLAAACAGHGILGVPDFEVAPDLRSGTLVRVLPAWRIEDTSLHLVFPPRRHVLGRVRAFADFVTQRFAEPPWRYEPSIARERRP
jgi:DNA-binding transcriptional LysR family regulator